VQGDAEVFHNACHSWFVNRRNIFLDVWYVVVLGFRHGDNLSLLNLTGSREQVGNLDQGVYQEAAPGRGIVTGNTVSDGQNWLGVFA
jgi:hypothetical protein